MSYLQSYGIIGKKSGANKSATVFENLIPDIFASELQNLSPSEFVKAGWERYQSYEGRNNNLNGAIFEFLLAVVLIREKLFPFYLQAQVAFVPNINYDILLYAKDHGPICISAKTSLRERYKQADLEAFALKNVHRRAKCLLITLNPIEAKTVSEKINRGDVFGLDEIIVADTKQFDEMIEMLRSYEYIRPESVEIITATYVVTANNVAE